MGHHVRQLVPTQWAAAIATSCREDHARDCGKPSPTSETLIGSPDSDLISSDYLRLCHSVVNAARGRKSLLKRLHSDWVAPRVLVGQSAGEAVDAGRRQLKVLLFQSDSGHCAT